MNAEQPGGKVGSPRPKPILADAMPVRFAGMTKLPVAGWSPCARDKKVVRELIESIGAVAGVELPAELTA